MKIGRKIHLRFIVIALLIALNGGIAVYGSQHVMQMQQEIGICIKIPFPKTSNSISPKTIQKQLAQVPL